jgi:hypothetical protein
MSFNVDDPTYLKLWYKFEDTTDSVRNTSDHHYINDTTGNYGISLQNGAVLSSSEKKFGNKSLDLTQGKAYATIPETRVQNLDNFSVSMWFKTGVTDTDFQTVFAIGDNYNTGLYFQFSDRLKTLSMRLTSGNNISNNDLTLNDNQWHHLVATYERKNEAGYDSDHRGDIKYYIDGNLIHTSVQVTIFNSTENSNYQFIGKGYFAANPTLGGYVDDYRSYEYTLSATDVTALYNYGSVSNDIVCFLEGTQITCLDEETAEEIQLNIEDITPGTLVKTYVHGFVPVDCINYKMIENPTNTERVKNRLYKCSPDKYPSLKKDLILTGSHAILEDSLSDKQTNITVDELGDIFVTDGKLRLMAMADERAEPYVTKSKQSKVWHVCLEHEDYNMNYGIYANGLLVESCSKRNMDLGMP